MTSAPVTPNTSELSNVAQRTLTRRAVPVSKKINNYDIIRLVAALQVAEGQEIMLISSTGTLVRTGSREIAVVGRNTQGVRLIRLGDGERLAGVECIPTLAGEETDVAPAAPDGQPESTDPGSPSG